MTNSDGKTFDFGPYERII